MLDKVEPPDPPEGYFVSAAFRCVTEASNSICSLVESNKPENMDEATKKGNNLVFVIHYFPSFQSIRSFQFFFFSVWPFHAV